MAAGNIPLITKVLGVGIGASIVRKCFLKVDAGERGVVFDRFHGVLDETKGEGTHLIVPVLQKPYIMSIRSQPFELKSTSSTKDLQMVNLSLRLLTRPHESRLPTIFKTLGTDYQQKVLPAIGDEVLKAVVAQFTAEELLTERSCVSGLVRDSLVRRAKDFNIELDDVSITELSYGKEFSMAVERKQVAQQEAERSKYVVKKAEQEKRAAVIRAEGESESAKLISDATSQSGMGLIELRKIEAAKDIVSKLSRTPNVVFVPGGNSMLLGLNNANPFI